VREGAGGGGATMCDRSVSCLPHAVYCLLESDCRDQTYWGNKQEACRKIW
jgi:hypothetical protein